MQCVNRCVHRPGFYPPNEHEIKKRQICNSERSLLPHYTLYPSEWSRQPQQLELEAPMIRETLMRPLEMGQVLEFLRMAPRWAGLRLGRGPGPRPVWAQASLLGEVIHFEWSIMGMGDRIVFPIQDGAGPGIPPPPPPPHICFFCFFLFLLLFCLLVF